MRALFSCALTVLLLLIEQVQAASPEIYPLSQVKRGQKGYGLTTFKGSIPERFSFEVIDVSRNFLPKMDIILVKSEDPKLAVSGFWQGMSGSPLFIEGKLACAFSYGFRFNKLAIGGCTPIHYMKAEGFQPPRNTRKNDTHSAVHRNEIPQAIPHLGEWLATLPPRSAGKPTRSPWSLLSPLPRPAPDPETNKNGLVAASIPLAFSGFTAPAFEQAKVLMSSFPIVPLRGGGSGNPKAGPNRFVLGGPIGVQLLRGDMTATATGTVSYVQKNKVLAFGHPLFQAGEIYAPVASAYVHTVIPSAMNAFVLASPMRELGSLIQDRQSTIMADTHVRSSMVPVEIEIQKENHSKKSTFHVEVINNRFFTAGLAAMATANAVSHYLPDRERITMQVNSSIYLLGHKPLHFIDSVYTDSGVMNAIGGTRGLRVLVPLLNNPFGSLEIKRVKISITLRYNTNYGVIERVRLFRSELIPGQRSFVEVQLRSFGSVFTERIPFDVPENLADSIVRLEVTSGDRATPDVAPPKTLQDFLHTLRHSLPGNVYAVTLYTAEEGAAINGKLVRDLPASALDKLYNGSSTAKATQYHAIARSTAPSQRVLMGHAKVLVKVANAP